MINTKYNKLTIISEPYMKICGNRRRSFVKCRCDCGAEKDIRLAFIKDHTTKSCGCLFKYKLFRFGPKILHGLSKHPLYAIWRGMKTRCYNPKNKFYKDYGGRGIKVCIEFLSNFLTFYHCAINKGWKLGLVLDRIDVNGHYEPNNIRFVTTTISSNNKRTSHFIIAFGEKKTIAEWADDTRCSITQEALCARLKLGWNPEKAITIPILRKSCKI